MNENTFKSNFVLLEKLYGKNIDVEIVKLYWNHFKSISDEKFNHICEQIRLSFVPSSTVPFPTIAHFVEISGIGGENRARQAVKALVNAIWKGSAYRSVSFGDPALHETIERFGGWPHMAKNCDAEWWQFNEKNFIACYESSYQSGACYQLKCKGICEEENTGRLLTEKQKAFAEQQKVTHYIEWVGFDENIKLLEQKESEGVSLITDNVNNMLENIGKIIN